MQISFYPFLLILLSITYSTQNENFLVIQILNVGARYPKEISGDWTTHLNQLTHIGMRQLYLLGRHMANRFTTNSSFLQQRNIPSEVVIKAAYANDNVTVASAYAYSRGLYPPGTGQRLSAMNIERGIPPFLGGDFKKYQKEIGDAALPNYYDTVPIMVEGGGPDYLLSATTHCNGLVKMVENRFDEVSYLSEKESRLWEEGQPTFGKLKKIFKKDINKTDDSIKFRDYFEAAKYFGEKNPSDIEDKDLKLLNDIYHFHQFEKYFDDPLVTQTVLNSLLIEVKETLENGIKEKKSRKRLLSYMVEDQTVYAMAKLITEEIKHEILFASLLEIVVVTGDKDTFYVTATIDGKELKWKDKEQTISHIEFLNWIKANTEKEDYKKLCLEGRQASKTDDTTWMIIGICMIPLLLLVVAMTIVYAMRKHKTAEPVDIEAGIEF